MYAHGSWLDVSIESTLLYVASIPLHAQRYIPVCKSVPESQSNGISVLGAPGCTQSWFIMMEDKMKLPVLILPTSIQYI